MYRKQYSKTLKAILKKNIREMSAYEKRKSERYGSRGTGEGERQGNYLLCHEVDGLCDVTGPPRRPRRSRRSLGSRYSSIL